MNAPPPPVQLEPYVTALGVEAAVAFFLTFGGAELYIPRDPKGRSKLVEVLGLDKARALSHLAEHHILPKRVPLGKDWVAKVLASEDLPVAEIARRLHTTDVTVRKYLADAPAAPAPGRRTDPRQRRLF